MQADKLRTIQITDELTVLQFSATLTRLGISSSCRKPSTTVWEFELITDQDIAALMLPSSLPFIREGGKLWSESR